MLAEILAGLLKDGTIVGVLVAFVGGWLLKQAPAFPNRFIPIATAVVAVVTQFINFFTGHPVVVPVEPAPVDSMGFFDLGIIKALIAAALQWIMVDGAYQTQKRAVLVIADEEGTHGSKTQAQADKEKKK